MRDYIYVIAATMLTICCWGIYGPVLHKGQAGMNDSRLRPLICVGLAYFVIAVAIPVIVLAVRGEAGVWSTRGIAWSLAGGAAGAIGALGIILAFNAGGSPSYVMPLVFGGAPVVNAFLTIYMAGTWGQVRPMFLAGLILVAVGGVTVLLFAPKPHRPAKSGAPAAAKAAAGHAKA